MNNCLCCSGKLLRHIRSTGVYWFCASCRQEMPNVDDLNQTGRGLSDPLRTSSYFRTAIGGHRVKT